MQHCSVVLRAKPPLNILYGPGGIFIFANKYQDGLLFRDLQRAIHRRPGMLKDIHRRFIMYQLLSATRYLHAGNGKHNLFCISVYCTAIFLGVIINSIVIDRTFSSVKLFGRIFTVRFGPNDRIFFCRTQNLFFM